MYKVFVDNKTIFLTESLDINFLEKDTLYYHYLSTDNLQMLIDEFVAMDDCNSLLIYHENLENVWVHNMKHWRKGVIHSIWWDFPNLILQGGQLE